MSYVPTLRRPSSTYLAKKRWNINQQRGVPTTPIDSSIVKAHIDHLRGLGMTDTMIAAAAGCGNTVIGQIRKGRFKTTLRPTAVGILAVTPTPHPRQRIVLAVGAIRRLKALMAIGWKTEDIGRRIDMTVHHIRALMKQQYITYPKWSTIKAVYDELSGTPGPSANARRRARSMGHPTPMAWDGIDIDDPNSQPRDTAAPDGEFDEVVLARIIAGRHDGPVNGAEREAVIEHAIKNRWTNARLAESLNLKEVSADRALARYRAKQRLVNDDKEATA